MHRPALVNVEPGLVFYCPDGRPRWVSALEIADGVVVAVRSILNPTSSTTSASCSPAAYVLLDLSEAVITVRDVRLIVARCEVVYTGRLNAVLPVSTRLLMLKADGSVLVHADSGGYKPLNWMTPPTVVEEDGDLIVVRKRAGRSEDRLEIRLLEVLSDVEHEMGEAAALEKDGVEHQLQAELAAQPGVLEDELTLVRREWPTDIGPVDLMCRDGEGGWVAVEIKRIGTIEAVEQLSRYLEYIRVDPARAECRGILAAQSVKPQAVKLADLRGLGCVEVDLELLRGEREPELTLFG